MAPVGELPLVCAALLLIQGVSPVHFSRSGVDISLPCVTQGQSGPACSDINWWHYRPGVSEPLQTVSKGRVMDHASSRFSLSSDCSLRLHNVTRDEAGLYRCDHESDRYDATTETLNVLTVSPVRDDVDEAQIGLQCELSTLEPYCYYDEFRWFDQNNNSLSGRKTNCISYLGVERQSQRDRTFVCQFVQKKKVEVFTEYRLKGHRDPVGPTPGADGGSNLLYIIVGAVVSLLLLLAFVIFLFFQVKSKRSTSQTSARTEVDDPWTHGQTDPEVDPESDVNYATINHQTRNGKKNVKTLDQTVTYATVCSKTTTDCSNSAIYSTVKK